MKLPSSTSAATKVMSAEETYWGTVYELAMWKLEIIPTNTIISDASRICLQYINNISLSKIYILLSRSSWVCNHLFKKKKNQSYTTICQCKNEKAKICTLWIMHLQRIYTSYKQTMKPHNQCGGSIFERTCVW